MDQTPTKKRPSGGARATKAKHEARAAARRREIGSDAHRDWLKQVDRLGKAPKSAEAAHEWLGRAAVLIVSATMRDVGLPLEQMRRDAMKQIEQASKVLDPAKLSEQLAELEQALEELRSHAGNVETGEDRPAPSGASLC